MHISYISFFHPLSVENELADYDDRIEQIQAELAAMRDREYQANREAGQVNHREGMRELGQDTNPGSDD